MHVPFCESKCAYCDFYSYRADVALYESYTSLLCEQLETAGNLLKITADTLYFGGGTPSLLGGKAIARITNAAKAAFGLENAEITVEANPADDLMADFEAMAEANVNRLSLGVQSADERELCALSRRHSVEDVTRTVKAARQSGIDNISLDIMLGIPYQTMQSLERTVEFVLNREPRHISCYILKLEPNTVFGRNRDNLPCLPDDDTVADMYLFVSNRLKQCGYEHYEISNFAKPGFMSKHNSSYWKCGEYLGLGPAAHSFLNGRRFYFERDTDKYFASPTPVFDGLGGDCDEFIMLGLRLAKGIDLEELGRLYGKDSAERLMQKCEKFKNTDLLEFDGRCVKLTQRGFLLSNAIISELLF